MSRVEESKAISLLVHLQLRPGPTVATVDDGLVRIIVDLSCELYCHSAKDSNEHDEQQPTRSTRQSTHEVRIRIHTHVTHARAHTLISDDYSATMGTGRSAGHPHSKHHKKTRTVILSDSDEEKQKRIGMSVIDVMLLYRIAGNFARYKFLRSFMIKCEPVINLYLQNFVARKDVASHAN